jgi:hypothetical protein
MSAATGQRPMAFQYVVLRCVPRVDREEFLNVGVVLQCQDADFLGCASHVDDDRLLAFAPETEVAAVRSALEAAAAVCRGDVAAGAAGQAPQGTRFGFLSAPRSTVVQPGPIHGGVTVDPAAELEHLLRTLVG